MLSSREQSASLSAKVARRIRRYSDRVIGSRHSPVARKCPICGNSCRRFLPHGEPPRDDARCPSCGSLERHRMLWLWLEGSGRELGGIRLLHFAPERCLTQKLRSRVGGGYVSADLARDADVYLDITSLPIADRALDAILCSHVLEHIPDDGAAMRELHRVMKPDGWGVFETPVDLGQDHTDEDPTAPEEERIRRFGQHDHVRLYGRDYPDRLRSAGFEVSPLDMVERLGKRKSRRYGLQDGKLVWLVEK